MKRTSILILLMLVTFCINAQQRAELIKHVSGEITADSIKPGSLLLNEVVVTGQFEPQSARNSVYSIRTISNEQIRLRNAVNLLQVLNTEPGIRFNNDLTLGTSDISLMGVSGKGVKILLDGVPLLDRSETRESLGQVDVNTIDRIEIVEGPMSVSYGTDALVGVINIITKKNAGGNQLSVTAKVQEESAGKEYSGFGLKGSHNQNLGINFSRKGWNVSATLSRNDFGGWQGQSVGRELDWNPKDQWLAGTRVGYSNSRLNIWYSLNAADETISLLGKVNPNNNMATDKDFVSHRFLHQMQGEWLLSGRMSISGAVSRTDYSRRTKTSNLNTLNGDRRLSLEEGSQDRSLFDHTFFRGTLQYKSSEKLSFQPGFEVNLNGSSGDRILGSPEINDYAIFLSSEWKMLPAINIRPGLRMVRNSVYDAPPVIPSLNTLFTLSKKLDMRLSYARGFRAPSLRELYFNFFDASHSITGNTDLKAEYSNSFNGSLTRHEIAAGGLNADLTLSGFYNVFTNLIEIGFNPKQPDINSYINIGHSKTAGGSLQGNLRWRALQGALGFSYTGRYDELAEGENPVNGLPEYVWWPEVTSNIIYNIPKAGASFNLAYKFNGKKPAYEVTTQNGEQVLGLAKTSAYNFADFSVNKSIKKLASVSLGVKNLFNVTRVNNTSADVGGAHSTGGPVPVSYGRSFFLGLTVQWSKNLSQK